jgi:RNA polymerase sigma-70 factor (ECF subfamily)
MGDDGAWEWQAGSDPSPEQQLEARERQKAIQALLETLSPVDRVVVTLYYWQDLSYEEIAETTHLSVSAVKSRLFRARRGMAECWAQSQNDGGSQCNTGMREAHYVGHAQ